MNTTPLKEFEIKYEEFIRIWMRFFFNVESYILVTEILMEKKKAMIQYDLIRKDQLIDYPIESSARKDKLAIFNELYLTYIMDKRDFLDPEIMEQDMINKENGELNRKENTEDKNKRDDKCTIWGFDLDNIGKFQEYISRMKEQCQSQKNKNMNELGKIERSYTSNPEQDQRQKELNDMNKDIEYFVDKSLHFLENKLKELISASNLIDVKKSLYHPETYNRILTQEKDNSLTFNAYGVDLKQGQYPKLLSYCQANGI